MKRANGHPPRITSQWDRRRYVQALLRGGYPELQRLPARHHGTWFDSYLSRLLTVDLPDVSSGLSSDRLAAVLRMVAANQSGELVAARLMRLQAGQLLDLTAPGLLGLHLEAFAVAQLLAQRGWSQADFEVFHFRDRDGLEVDVVLEFDDGAVFLLEVKATSTIRAEHSRSIRTLGVRLGARFLGGAVLGLVERSAQLAERVWALPISALWEHPRA